MQQEKNSKKTVGIVSAHYLPHLGGVERYVHNMAGELVKRGYRVVIITSCLSGMKQTEEDNQIEIFRLPCFEWMGGRLPVLKINHSYKVLLRKLEEISFDEMIINTRLYVLCAWGSLYCQKHKIPVLLIEHGTAHMRFSSALICKAGEVYEHMLTAFIKKRCKRFYGVSQACNEWLLHFGIKAEGILYNAVHLDDYTVRKNSYREQFNIPEEKMIITYVGRLIEEKGIIKLVEAFMTLQAREKNVCLVIAGDGGLAETIRQLSGSDIIMLGKISHEEVISLLKEADILCLPTDYPEGFPTAVLEAAVCNCCIIATGNGGTRELIKDNTYGYLLEENTAAEIECCLERAVKDKSGTGEKAEKIRQLALERFTWEKTVDSLEKIYDWKCADGSSNG